MDKTLSTLQTLASVWPPKMKLGVEFNTPVSIGFSDEEYEVISCVEFGLRGTGSISYGYDHTNHSETKSLSLIQPKKCKKCGSKNHFFSKECICGSNDFKYIHDSRWGIDCKAHFEYDVKEYYLWALIPEDYSNECTTYYLKCFLINSTNKSFEDILKIQLERSNNKVNKNFLPFSSDFYSSNPIEKCCFRIQIDNIYGLNIVRCETNEIIYNQKIVKKLKKVLIDDFENNKDIYQYDELTQFINVRNKKTNHGTRRGKTTRRD